MTIKASYPTIEPTLSLDFANSRRLDPRVTFTRGTVGTYFDAAGVLRTAAVNEPRFDHDPATGESLGLLVEEARTNLWAYSEQFEIADWTKTRSSIATNTIAAPNGTLTADTLIEDSTASATHQIGRPASVTAGSQYTWSIYCKTAGRSHITLSFASQFPANSFADFNLSAGTIVSTGALGADNVRMQPIGNGWYRLSITAAATTTATSSLVAYMNNGTSISYTGDGTSGLYLWGAQVETGAFPTSYIKTEGYTVTRQADTAVMTGANFSSWYRQDQGTVFAEFGPYPSSTSRNYGIYQIDNDTTDGNSMRAFAGGGTGAILNVQSSSISQVYITAGGLLTPSSVSKYASAYKENSFARSFNGGTAAVDTDGSVPAVNRLYIATGSAGVSPLCGTIRSIRYWNTRLPDATLQALTAS